MSDQLYIGDHVQDVDDNDDDATMLVVGLPPETASEHVVDGDPDAGTAATVADYNPDYPEDDRVIEVIFAQRTRVDVDDSRRYAYPRSRLRRTAAVHDVEGDGE